MPRAPMRYVRKINERYVYGYTPALAADPAFIECDKNGIALDDGGPDASSTAALLAQLQAENAALRARLGVEDEPVQEPELPPIPRVSADPTHLERANQAIELLRPMGENKAELAKYANEQYGETLDDRMTFDLQADQVRDWARAADAAEAAAQAGTAGL